MRQKARTLLSVSVWHAANDGAITVLPLLLPVIITFIPMSYTQVGVLTAAGFGVTLVVQLAASVFAHRLNGHAAIGSGIAVMGIFLALLTFATDYASLLVITVGMRIGASFYHPLGLPLVSRAYPGKDIDMAMGIQSSAGDIGVFAALVTTGALGAAFGWKSPFLLWCAICIVAGAAGVGLTWDIVRARSRNKNGATGQAEKAGNGATRPAPQSSFAKVASRISLLFVPLIVAGAGWNIIMNYGPLMLSRGYGLGIWQYTALIALWVGIGAVATLIFGKITGKVGRDAAIMASFVLVMLGGIFIWFFASVYLAVAAMVVYGMGLFITYPAMFAYVSERVGEENLGKAFGLVFTAQLFGGFLFSLVSGVIADAFGIKTPFIMLTALAILALAFSGYFIRRRQNA